MLVLLLVCSLAGALWGLGVIYFALLSENISAARKAAKRGLIYADVLFVASALYPITQGLHLDLQDYMIVGIPLWIFIVAGALAYRPRKTIESTPQFIRIKNWTVMGLTVSCLIYAAWANTLIIHSTVDDRLARTIAAGMSKRRVIEILGTPFSIESEGSEWTYYVHQESGPIYEYFVQFDAKELVVRAFPD